MIEIEKVEIRSKRFQAHKSNCQCVDVNRYGSIDSE